MKNRHDYFKREKRLLKLLGVSFTGNESRIYKIYSIVIIFGTMGTYPFLQFADVFKHDFSIVIDILSYIFGSLIAFIKVLTLLTNRMKVKKMLEKLGQKPFLADFQRGGKKEEELLKECIWITNTQTKIYWSVAATAFTTAVIFSLSQRLRSNDYHDWEFTYGPFTILNVTHSPNYEISWFYQNLSVFVVACHFVTVDLLASAVLAHISYQFKILQNNLRRLVENAYRRMLNINASSLEYSEPVDSSTIPWKYLNQSLQEAINYHSAIIDLAQDMEEIFSKMLLTVYVSMLGMLCFMVYNSSLYDINDFRLVRNLAEVTSISLQVLIICFWGEQVVFESQNVSGAAYEMNFVGSNVKFQKNLILIMRRSQMPVKLTAGRFTDMCLATFVWVLRTSYSAFMVLRKTNLKNT